LTAGEICGRPSNKITNNIVSIKKLITKPLTFSLNCEILDLSNPNPLGDKMPEFKVQREYTNWEQITVEADSKEEALALAEDDEDLWEYAIDVNSYNYTGETWVGEEDE
jgi:hypothetical protein